MSKPLKLKSKNKKEVNESVSLSSEEGAVLKVLKDGKKKKKKTKSKDSVTDLSSAEKKILEAMKKDFNKNDDGEEIPYNVLFKHHGLNYITGGIPGGIFIEIHGPSQCGKSYLMYDLGLATIDAGGWYYQNDIERAYKKIIGVRLGLEGKTRFKKENVNNMEQCFINMKKFVLNIRKYDKNCPILCAVDSYPLFELNESLKELEEEYKKIENAKNVSPVKVKGFAAMKKVAKWTEEIKKFLKFINEHKVIFLLLNQERTNHLVLFGDKKTTNADQSIGFMTSTRLRGALGAKIKDKDTGRIIGRKVTWQCLKSRHPDIPPFMEVETEIIYRSGVKPYSGLRELLIREGVAKETKVGKSKGVKIGKLKFNDKQLVEYLEKHPDIIYSAK